MSLIDWIFCLQFCASLPLLCCGQSYQLLTYWVITLGLFHYLSMFIESSEVNWVKTLNYIAQNGGNAASLLTTWWCLLKQKKGGLLSGSCLLFVVINKIFALNWFEVCAFIRWLSGTPEQTISRRCVVPSSRCLPDSPTLPTELFCMICIPISGI